MSGGHFDYIQFRIMEAADQIVEELPGLRITENPKIVTEIVATEQVLREAAIRLQRLDWFLSGDDGPESFLERLDKELQENQMKTL